MEGKRVLNSPPEKRKASAGSNGRSRSKRGRRGLRIFTTILKVLGTLAVMGCLTVGMFLWIFMQYVQNTLAPELKVDMGAFTMQQTSVVYYQDRSTGEWKELQRLMGTENRTLVTFDQLPDHLVEALVCIEDTRFWQHHGVDWKRTGGAVLNMFFSMKDTFGGSTITQQTIKNLTGENEGTVKRKITEIFRALELENNYKKEEILETYLNLVYFGNHAYGVQAAADTYFGKDVSELTLAESAMIVGLTKNPSKYNPLGADWQKEAARNRQVDVLWTMKESGSIGESQYERAKNEELIFVGTPEYEALHGGGEEELDENGQPIVRSNDNVFSYFVDALFNDVRDDLAEKMKISRGAAEQLLYSAGYKIYATVDLDIQEIAESVYEDQSNLDKQNSKGDQLQSAITIMDPYTGNVVGIVGGIGEKTASRIENLALSHRPCGSAFKPVSVYAPAMDAGIISPASIIDDYPVRLNDSGSGGYPRNTPQRYRGLIPMRTAIQVSTNTTAVRALQQLTFASSFEFLTEKLGFELDSRDIAEAPLAMGGLTYGVSTLEMAAAYSSFANSGIYTQPKFYTLVMDADGELDANGDPVSGSVILENPSQSWMAMSSSTAFMMTELMKETMSSGGTGASANFSGMNIAGKTGTTTNNYDRYFVGYTPYYCAAVWVGYPKSNADIGKFPTSPANTLWKLVMEEIHKELPNREFATPSTGTHFITTCLDCGLLATEACDQAKRVQTVRAAVGMEPEGECSCHVTIEVCTHTVTAEDGTTTEVRHLAGQYCPEENVQEILVTTVHRDTVYRKGGSSTYIDLETGEQQTVDGIPIAAEDDDALVETWLRRGLCPDHTAETWNPPVDPGQDIYYDEFGNPVDAEGNPIILPPDYVPPSDSGMIPPTDTTPTDPTDSSGPTTPTDPTTPSEPGEPGGEGGGLSGFLDSIFRGNG